MLPSSPNLLPATPLLRAGWKITLAEGPKGSQITIPGAPRAFPLSRDEYGSVIVTFVETPRGLLLRDDSIAHRCLIAHDFILDTGAEVCLIGAESISLLSGLGSIAPLTITGVGGVRTMPVDSGFIVIEPPRGATAQPPATAVDKQRAGGPGVLYAHRDLSVFDETVVYFDGEPATAPDPATRPAAAVRAAHARATAFPPARSVDDLAEKFNLNNAIALGSFIDACPLGIRPGLKRDVVAGKDYSRGLATAALLKTPAIHASRYTISMTLRDTMPPGHVWWTDVSNMRPPDFDGNVLSRLFAEERTGCAATFYATRKDTATLIDQMGEMVSWISEPA